jgi:MYXO-CTERM domain-containing protein
MAGGRALGYGRRVLRSPRVIAFAALAAAFLGAGSARAHFILVQPPAMTEQSPLGDPQKAPPCGDNGDAVPTGEVTAFLAGDTIKISIDETIYHPGHYRVAIAVNDPSELPEPPPVTPGDTPCGSAPIDPAPAFPVLADGILVHADPFDGPQSFDVKLPDDLSCEKCTLQVIQFMSNHGLNNPGGCYYHHCATISVSPGQASTTSGGGETTDAESGDETTEAPDTTAATGVTTTASSQGDTAGETSATGGGTSGAGTGTGTATGATATDGDTSGGSNEEGGCGCTGAGGHGPATLATLLALLGLRRRRH